VKLKLSLQAINSSRQMAALRVRERVRTRPFHTHRIAQTVIASSAHCHTYDVNHVSQILLVAAFIFCLLESCTIGIWNRVP
jgi:hypothetical protein